MRLTGLVLLGAWAALWALVPHGQVIPSRAAMGGVAVAGRDHVAAAWLAVPRGELDGTLHVVLIDEQDRVTTRVELPASPYARSFHLAAAGPDEFVLAIAHQFAEHPAFEVHRLSPRRHVELTSLRLASADDEEAGRPRFVGCVQAARRGARAALERDRWQLHAAGDEIAIYRGSEKAGWLSFLGPDGQWQVEYVEDTLVGAGEGHLVRYHEERGERTVTVAPGREGSWVTAVGRGDCLLDGKGAAITSVRGLRGGYARLWRDGNVGCVDGMRDGQSFLHRGVPTEGMMAARLALAADGGLLVRDERESTVWQRRVRLPVAGAPGAKAAVDEDSIHPSLRDLDVRYRLFADEGRRGLAALATRFEEGLAEVAIERHGDGTRVQVSPPHARRFDARPFVAPLGLLPLAVLALGVARAWRTLRRLRATSPCAPEAIPASGHVTLEGTLVGDGEPGEGLRLQVGRSLVHLFVEGAEVLRASLLRPRSHPGGALADTLAGAPVVASGTIEAGGVYREERTMRSGRGDHLLVGVTIAEGRALAARRLGLSLAMAAAGLVVWLATQIR